MEPMLNWFDRVILFFAPKWGAQRVRARVLARHFEAASVGRRTSGWSRRMTDANAAAAGNQLAYLRAQARDLVRNNPWATRGLNRIARNTVGWGIKPTAGGRSSEQIMALWAKWGETTQCDAAGRNNFYGLQELVMRTVVESGEVLIRRRRRRPDDGLAIPLQLQILEPDYIDTSIDGIKGEAGGDIIQGVEFDAIGRRVAYWLFDQHPGSGTATSPVSRRVPADGILHVFAQNRPGQVRGTSWFAPVDVRLHDFDEFEDATLMKQKIAACLAAFVTDVDGTGTALGAESKDQKTEQSIDSLEPGMILNLPAGRAVTVANPPAANDHQSFSMASLRGIAAGLGVTYEDLTGDYSQVNFSSARMARLAHMADVHSWRWNMLVPLFLAPAWGWMLDAIALDAGLDIEDASAEWTPPATPMIDPANEGLALARLVRSGAMTLDEMVREQGYDPKKFWREYAAGLKTLDDLGIILDSDARKTTGGGQLQSSPPSDDKSQSDDGDTAEVEADLEEERSANRDLRERLARAEAQAESDRERLERGREAWEQREDEFEAHLKAAEEAWRERVAECQAAAERTAAEVEKRHAVEIEAARLDERRAAAEARVQDQVRVTELSVELAKAQAAAALAEQRAQFAERSLAEARGTLTAQ